MNKAELIERIIDRITDPFTESLEDYANAEPMTLEEAKGYLEDYRRDDEAINDPDFAMPEETTPELLMEAYNSLIKKKQKEMLPMKKTTINDIVFNDHFPHNPTNQELEQTNYAVEGWTDAEITILSFQEIAEWFARWEQTDDDLKYDNVYAYIWDCLGNGMHPILDADPYEYSLDLIMNMTDGDPLAEMTLDDARETISAAFASGYSIPAILTPEYFLDVYNDLREAGLEAYNELKEGAEE